MAVSKDTSFSTQSAFPLTLSSDTLIPVRDSEKVNAGFFGALLSGASEIARTLTNGNSFSYNGITLPSGTNTMAAAIKSLTRVRFLKISNTVGWRYRDRGSLPPDAGNLLGLLVTPRRMRYTNSMSLLAVRAIVMAKTNPRTLVVFRRKTTYTMKRRSFGRCILSSRIKKKWPTRSIRNT